MPEVQTRETVAHWCGVDTRIGTLTCVLEENYCFDAEMYADELELEEKIEFREDHRSMLYSQIFVSMYLLTPASKLGQVDTTLSIFQPHRRRDSTRRQLPIRSPEGEN